MFSMRLPFRAKAKDEAEKPFWISYADMMTALMVLFLVTMAVALLAVTHKISEVERVKNERQQEIEKLLIKLENAAKDYPGIIIRGTTVNFGDKARFDTNSHALSTGQADALRTFTPEILKIARDPLGDKWLKRIAVEGFADQRGTYLHNLNLSLHRAERVLCILLADSASTPAALSEEDRKLVRNLFFVGGYSFNSLKDSLEESRRIELRLEFLELDEKRPEFPDAPLDNEQSCPVDR